MPWFAEVNRPKAGNGVKQKSRLTVEHCRTTLLQLLSMAKMHRIILCIAVLLLTLANSEKCDRKLKKDLILEHLMNLKDSLREKGCNLVEGGTVEDKAKAQIAETTKKPPKKKIQTEDICSNFEPVQDIPFNITCFYSDIDLKNGLKLETLVKTKLCTNVIATVKHRFQKEPTSLKFSFLNPEADEANVAKWRESAQVFMQIGSWDDPQQLTPFSFSKTFGLTGSRTKFVGALVEYLQKMNFDGLLISWYYPACPLDECKVGPASDEHRLNDFLKELNETMTAKDVRVKLAIEINIKPDNIYMGFGMSKIMQIVDIVLFENSCPENRTARDRIVSKPNAHDFYNFGRLDEMSKFIWEIANPRGYKAKFPILQKTRLVELETIIPFVKYGPKYLSEVDNITAKNLYKAVLYNDTLISTTKFKWPFPYLNVSGAIFPFADFNYTKTKVDHFMRNTSLQLSGVWIRDIWADDTTNECGCGSFPILRAANEAIGRSTCKLPNCPTQVVNV